MCHRMVMRILGLIVPLVCAGVAADIAAAQKVAADRKAAQEAAAKKK